MKKLCVFLCLVCSMNVFNADGKIDATLPIRPGKDISTSGEFSGTAGPRSIAVPYSTPVSTLSSTFVITPAKQVSIFQTQDELIIDIPGSYGDIVMTISGAMGFYRETLSTPMLEYTVYIGDYAPGTYTITLQSMGGGTVFGEFVIDEVLDLE